MKRAMPGEGNNDDGREEMPVKYNVIEKAGGDGSFINFNNKKVTF